MRAAAPVVVEALLCGRARAFRGAETSAIAKLPVAGVVAVGALGLAQDEQADPINHGGPDKALHHYPAEHYPHWRAVLGDHADLAPGGFGENISTHGLTEADVCLGDRFALGSAVIEVSHGRQPCWKLGHRFGDTRLAALVVESGRCGWYYRVVTPGAAQAGDSFALAARGLEAWPVSRVFAVLFGGWRRRTRAELAELAEMEVLAPVWRARARELMAVSRG